MSVSGARFPFKLGGQAYALGRHTDLIEVRMHADSPDVGLKDLLSPSWPTSIHHKTRLS